VRRPVLILVLAGCGSSVAPPGPDGSASDASRVSDGPVPAGDLRASSDAQPDSPGADAGGPTEVAAPTAEEVCRRYAELSCERESTCAPSIFALTWTDVETCRRRTVLQCAPWFTAPGSNYTPAVLAACTAAMARLDCAGWLAGSPPECRYQPGNLPTGSPCRLDLQCEGLDCRQSGAAFCGICGQKGGEGEPCGHGLDCQLHHACIRKVCSPMRKPGEPCDLTHWCDSGLACFAGVCGKERGPGEPCEVGEGQCGIVPVWLECVAPAGGTMGTCQPARSAGTGEACGPVPDGNHDVQCRAHGRCTSFTEPGTCVAAAADGQPCDERIPCLLGAFCVNGTCQVLDPASCK